MGIVVWVLLVALLAPWLAPKDPNQQFFDGLTLEGKPLPPGGPFPLGTDTLGRDLLSRLIWGPVPRWWWALLPMGQQWRSER